MHLTVKQIEILHYTRTQTYLPHVRNTVLTEFFDTSNLHGAITGLRHLIVDRQRGLCLVGTVKEAPVVPDRSGASKSSNYKFRFPSAFGKFPVLIFDVQYPQGTAFNTS